MYAEIKWQGCLVHWFMQTTAACQQINQSEKEAICKAFTQKT